jgi:hypothetical protein
MGNLLSLMDTSNPFKSVKGGDYHEQWKSKTVSLAE